MDLHNRLTLRSQSKLSRLKQAVHDIIIRSDTIIDELCITAIAEDEERRHIGFRYVCGHLYENLSPIIEYPNRLLAWGVASETVVEIETVQC